MRAQCPNESTNAEEGGANSLSISFCQPLGSEDDIIEPSTGKAAFASTAFGGAPAQQALVGRVGYDLGLLAVLSMM